MVAPTHGYLTPIDPTLAQTIQAILSVNTSKERQRQLASEELINWLAANGRIVVAKQTKQAYYLWRQESKVFRMDSSRFTHWLYRLTGSNPASRDFQYLIEACWAAGDQGESVEICKLAHWDGSFLRVSAFDGSVWRLDGESIEKEANGDGPILFEDDDQWEPYTADFSGNDALHWWTGLVNTDGPSEQYQLGLLAYTCAIFFTEMCPTRPILVLTGEAGSGKSMILRLLIRTLFGRHNDLSGVPDKPDGFTALMTGSLFVALDNLDNPEIWLRDKLARLTTGGSDSFRKLHTTNELVSFEYRSWLAVTSRTPDTLRRDDLADRLLIIPVTRIANNRRVRESYLLDQAEVKRDVWWGELLTLLNQVVSAIRTIGAPMLSTMRMADFESLGHVIANVVGQSDEWNKLITTWLASQNDLMAQDSIIIEALEKWLDVAGNSRREVVTRTLYDELAERLFGAGKPDSNWPRSVRAFGKQMIGLRRTLEKYFQVDIRRSGTHTFYTLGKIL